VLVLHDWGSAFGLDWARRPEKCVRGLVLMEFITRFPTWLDFPERGRERFKAFRAPGTGVERIIEKNEFVEQILPASIVRPLSDAEMKEYRAPFLEPKHREPTWRFPNELPIAGEPVDVYAMATAYEQWLLETDLPKLFFWDSPGGPDFRGKSCMVRATSAQLQSDLRRRRSALHPGGPSSPRWQRH